MPFDHQILCVNKENRINEFISNQSCVLDEFTCKNVYQHFRFSLHFLCVSLK